MHKSLFLLLFSFLFSQSVSDYTYTGAKPSAMAGAVVSEEGSQWSIFHNPAGITEREGLQFSAGRGNLYGFNWLPTFYLNGLIPISGFGKLGLSIQNFKTTYSGTELSTEQTISLAQGFELQQDKNSFLAVGYTVNYLHWELGRSAGPSGDGSDGIAADNHQSLTIDFGALASLRKKYRFGVLVKNVNSGAVGNGLSRQILPRRINIGVTYIPIPELATSIVTERLLGREEMPIKGALRFRIHPSLELVTGAQSNPNRFGTGCTISLGKNSDQKGETLFFSYGMLTHPVLPLTHQFSLGIGL